MASRTDRYGRPIPSQPAADKPMKRFFENVDRDALFHFLTQAGNDRYETLAILMQDPAYAGLSFAKLCQKSGVTLHEMQMLYTDSMRQLALLRMSNALPDLMLDVAEDAKSRLETCNRCDGFGSIPDGRASGVPRDCPICNATGKIRRVGDRQARDLIFESAKLIKQSGPMVAIQQNFSTGDSQLETILKKTRSIALAEPKEEETK